MLSCPQCQKVKRINLKDWEPLAPIPIVTEPMQEWVMDFAGPFEPASSSGKKYILILIDAATKWPEAVAMTSQRADKVADEMIKLFSRLGLPRVIRSDLWSSFKSELLTKFVSELGVNPCFSTSYHHQSLSSAERYIGTLKNMLRKFVSDDPRSWDKMIDLLMFAYREVPCVTTGFSSFELMYGRTARGPLLVSEGRTDAISCLWKASVSG